MGQTKINFSYIVAESEQDCNEKIISAWIEQVIEFDSMTEYQKFINDLKNGKKAYRIITPGCEVDNKICTHIMRQYNNNSFPEGGEDE